MISLKLSKLLFFCSEGSIVAKFRIIMNIPLGQTTTQVFRSVEDGFVRSADQLVGPVTFENMINVRTLIGEEIPSI